MPPDTSVAELDNLLKASRRVRRRFEGQWFTNLAYLVGRQWVTFDGVMVTDAQLEDWRAKPVDNRVLPTVRREIAKATKTKPVWVGVPRDTSDAEIQAARLRERVFEHYWRTLDARRKVRAALLWARSCSAGFMKVWWDSTRGPGRDILVGQDGRSVKDAYGAPIHADRMHTLPQDFLEATQPKVQRVAMGEPVMIVKSPFEAFPDPLASEEGLNSAEWFGEQGIYSRAYVADRYGKELPGDATLGAVVGEGMQLPDGIGEKGGEGYRGVRLRECWWKPSSEYPKGKRVVWAGTEILFEGDHPYDWLPYAMFRGIPVPGRFWPDSLVTHLISPQTQRNKRLAQIEENAERIGNPPLMRSAANEDVEWHGLPGEELVFQDLGTPGSVPQFLQVPELPSYIDRDLDRNEQSIREISSQHEVSGGQVPAGVTAAAAINMLVEQDDTVLGPDIDDMELAIFDVGYRLLRLLRDNCSDERIIQIAGPEDTWDLVTFRGDKLGDSDRDAVQVGSGVPQSKAAKQAALQEVLNMLVQSGVPLSERDMRRVLQEYEIGGLEQFFATIGRDARQVARENQKLASGAQLDINTFDVDTAHVDGHTDFQKSASYDELPPEIKQIFEMHVQLHRDRITRNQLNAAGLNAPPGPGDHSAAAQAPASGGNGAPPSGALPFAGPSTTA